MDKKENRSVIPNRKNSNVPRTIDFMKKFTDLQSSRIIIEGGEEFFKPFKPISQSDLQAGYGKLFDEIVFETDEENPDQL